VEEAAINCVDPEDRLVDDEDAVGDPSDADEAEERWCPVEERKGFVGFVGKSAVCVVFALEELRHEVAEAYVRQ
jgi:hypothetical protein